jgi:hypothetical protein
LRVTDFFDKYLLRNSFFMPSIARLRDGCD